MTLLVPKKQDQGNEKHLPVVEKIAPDQIKVTVGNVLHPMATEHWIQWIFVAQDSTYQIKKFESTDTPIWTFPIIPDQPIKVYEFCNLHGLWLTEIE
jgi:superoxide reductase